MYTIYCSRPPTCTYEGKEIVHSVFCILYSVCARSRSLCVMRVCVVQVCTVHVCVRCVSIVHIRYAHTTNAHSYHAPPCTLPVHPVHSLYTKHSNLVPGGGAGGVATTVPNDAYDEKRYPV